MHTIKGVRAHKHTRDSHFHSLLQLSRAHTQQEHKELLIRGAAPCLSDCAVPDVGYQVIFRNHLHVSAFVCESNIARAHD